MQSERKPRRSAKSADNGDTLPDARRAPALNGANDLPDGPATFEEALAQLDDIVAQLEDGQRTLEDSLALYERGVALSQRCQELLDGAELRVQRLRLSSAADEGDLSDEGTAYTLDPFEIDEG